jgi:Rhs element Vgr protein
MAAKSPIDDIDDPSINITVNVNGQPINDEYGIKSISVVHALNKISYAEVVLLGEVKVGSDSIPLSDGDDFSPGNKISISAGYVDSDESNIFSGLIVSHAVEINSESYFSFRILCKHAAVTMTYNEKEAEFFSKSDNAIISAITGTYGLSASVDSVADEQEAVFQRMSTDWDFILSRCDYNGFIVSMDGDTLTIGKPKVDGTADLKITFGDSLISFDATLSAENQPPSLKASAWDTKTQALISSSAAEPSVNAQGNLTAKTLSGKLGQSELNLISAAPLDTAELQSWANGELLRKRLSAIKGSVKFVGSALAKTGTLIELEGVGKKFEGSAFISSVMHTIDEDAWNTTVKFGLEYAPISKKAGFSYPAAAGQLPAIYGLQIATVKKISNDPKSQFRVMVNIASNAETQNGIWARMSNFYATSSAGAVFWPEVGDEVVVGFLESDPRYPVILGSMYSEKNQSPHTVSDENNYIKSLTTKSKMVLSFDEEKKIIKITTPGNNSITISDEDKGITIADQNSNSVKLSPDGIVLNSAKNIELKASQNITLDATGKISITAQQDVAVAGLNVSNEAQVGFTGKGSATAEISASGQTTVKGAIVMIN